MPTHKKGHDKDKYYFLAKEQGYRSRASYKLIQINKRYDFLSKAKVCVDLCAAPGGWCQVAEKNMPQGSIILGVDLLPIRAIRNVKTIVSDITTAECRKILQQELQGWKADVVLCDGAPNIGSAYSKDAYVQNELVIAALKTATEHLVEGGTFCTKVYRSVDYNSIMWVLQQLFEDVQTMKPNSSRSQSSEIFLICLKYMNPKSIDPKLLDPNYVFKEVKDPGLKKVDVLHKKYETSNKRQRSGYDETLGILLSAKVSISDFLKSVDPVQILTDVNELVFKSEEDDNYKNHELTTPEMIFCFQDLRVLGKIDFKKILKWRQQLRLLFNIKTNKGPTNGDDDEEETEGDDDGEDAKTKEKKKKQLQQEGLTSDEIMEIELNELQLKQKQKQRQEKKKENEIKSKTRKRLETGLLNNAFEEAHDVELFSFRNLNDPRLNDDSDNAAAGAVVGVDDEEDGELMNYVIDDDDEQESDEPENNVNDDDEEEEYDEEKELAAMEEELDYDYKRYISKKKVKDAEEDAKLKASKKYRRQHAASGDDDEDGFDDADELEFDPETTSRRKDEEDDDDDDDKFVDDKQNKKKVKKLKKGRIDSEEAAAAVIESAQLKIKNKKKDNTAMLKHTSEWFSQPWFKESSLVLNAAKSVVTTATNSDDEDDVKNDEYYYDYDDDEGMPENEDVLTGDNDDDDLQHIDEPDTVSKKTNKKKKSEKPPAAAAAAAAAAVTTAIKATKSTTNSAKFEMPDMPKTDKEKRKEKRKKTQERNDRRQQRRTSRDAPDDDDDDEDNTFTNRSNKTAGASSQELMTKNNGSHEDDDENKQYTEEQLKRMRLIEKGMGKALPTPVQASKTHKESRHGFEIVPREESEALHSSYFTHITHEDENNNDQVQSNVRENGKRKRRGKRGGNDTNDANDSDDDDDWEDIVDAGAEEESKLRDEYMRAGDKNHLRVDSKPSAESRVMTLALGTLMLNPTRKKALIDASYNRYAWNENIDDLPSWFIEDEMRHNKPQVPVPSSLVEQIKGRFKMTGTKEIKKVAEARMRKRKRALNKLTAAKKKANAMAESTDMSQREKMKAISRAMRESKITKPGKVYVITRKTGGASSGVKSSDDKGKLKFVDKRLKKDKRATRVAKKRSKK